MPLPRLQLFELEDLSWFPRVIRDLATDYLVFMEKRFALHRPAVPLLREALVKSGATRVVDLCSGAGGPVPALVEALAASGLRVPFTLTDKYPNLRAFRRLAARYPEHISYAAYSCDATMVPPDLLGLRTMFNAFHHFAPSGARSVLASAVKARQAIAIFEIPERTLAMLLPLLFTPLLVAVATPWIRPFQWRRLLWTYGLPLVPLTCWWDGVVSVLRAYTVGEMLAMTHGFSGYEWTAARVAAEGAAGHLTYLIGLPAQRD